jgi:hypothetical protein
MKLTTFNQNLKKIREYGKLFGIRLILAKGAESSFEPKTKTIRIDSSEPYDSIINILLHEMGHHHDDNLHPHETDNHDSNTAYGKLNKHDHEIDLLEKKRIKLAGLIEDGAVKNIIMKIAYDRSSTLSRAEEEKLRQFRGDKKNWLSMRQRKLLTHPYRYYSKACYLTEKQREKIIEVETRAWEYGEKIAKMIKVKFTKSFYKQKQSSLRTYKLYILTIDPLYKF